MGFDQQRGGFNNNNGQVRKFDSTYYSRIYFMNPDTNTRVNVTYSTGLMKLTLATSNGNNGNGFKNWEDQISISLTGTKATLLLKSIVQYERAIEEGTITMNNAYGVVTGMGEVQTVIQFHLNKVSSGKAFTIAQVSPDGAYMKKFTFEFPDNYDYRLEWTNKDAMQFDKAFEPDLQYEMLKQALKEFSETCNGAAGYNAVDLARYDINNIKNLLNAIGTQVGVPINNNHSNGGYNRNSSGGFFGNNNQNQNQGQSNHKTLDQIQSEYLSDDDEE